MLVSFPLKPTACERIFLFLEVAPMARTTIVSAAALLLASACSTGADSTALEFTDQDDVQLDEGSFAGESLGNEARTSEWAEPTILCGKAGDLLPDGTRRAFDDVYYPNAINAEIAQHTPLREALGFDGVANCEQAHLWSTSRLSIVEGEPAEASPPEPVAAEPDPGPIEKVWEGLNHVDDSIPMLLKAGIDGDGLCSSVAITRRHLLTAAHCVGANTTVCGTAPNQVACNRDETFEIVRATAGGGRVSYGTYSVTTYKHEGYGGIGDPGDDIALLEVRSGWNLPAAAVRSIALVTPSAQTSLAAAGWGRTSQYNPSNAGYLKKPKGNGVFNLDWVPRDATYFFDDNDDDVNLCKGDSGGPVVSGLGVVGLFSEFEADSGHFCRHRSGLKERWVTVGTKIGWIEARLRNHPNYTCPGTGGFCCTHTAQSASCL
jgi:trypsin